LRLGIASGELGPILESDAMTTTRTTYGWTLSRPRLAALAPGLVLCLLIFGGAAAVSAAQAPIGLGTAAPFAVLAGTGISNTGATTITGDVGLSPGSSITGSPTVNGATDVDNAAAVQAKSDLTTAYNSAASAASTSNLTGQDLGNKNLSPGVYTFSSSAQLTGPLTLSGNGVFIFQIGSTLTTASGATVLLVNGAQACNVFWQVASSATLGTTTHFQGTLMAYTSISLDTGANILDGRALAQTGAVTLDDNQITAPTTCTAPVATSTPTATPTPGILVPNTGADVGSQPGGALLVLGGLAVMVAGLGLTWRLRSRRPARS
jgi:hypothetical protein